MAYLFLIVQIQKQTARGYLFGFTSVQYFNFINYTANN